MTLTSPPPPPTPSLSTSKRVAAALVDHGADAEVNTCALNHRPLLVLASMLPAGAGRARASVLSVSVIILLLACLLSFTFAAALLPCARSRPAAPSLESTLHANTVAFIEHHVAKVLGTARPTGAALSNCRRRRRTRNRSLPASAQRQQTPVGYVLVTREIYTNNAAADLQHRLLMLPERPARVSIHLKRASEAELTHKLRLQQGTSSSHGRPLESTIKSAANISKQRGTGIMAAAAAETAAEACSHMQRMHSCASKDVAAPEAARAGSFSNRKAQSRMTLESPSEFDRYLHADDELSSSHSDTGCCCHCGRGSRTRVCFALEQTAGGNAIPWDYGTPTR